MRPVTELNGTQILFRRKLDIKVKRVETHRKQAIIPLPSASEGWEEAAATFHI